MRWIKYLRKARGTWAAVCGVTQSQTRLKRLSSSSSSSRGTWWRRQWHPTPVLLPGKSQGRGSLVGCRPFVHYESDITERLHFHFSLSHIGEGNGNPLQGSCLENPRNRGAWWAAVYGVAHTWGRTHMVRHDCSGLAATAAEEHGLRCSLRSRCW